MDLPQIFGPKGVFVEPSDTSGLDAPTLERLDGVRVAYRNLETAQSAEQAAADNIATCLAAIKTAEDYRSAHYPPDTFRDLWVSSFGSEKEKQRHAARKH
jgi:hypothetical protein